MWPFGVCQFFSWHVDVFQATQILTHSLHNFDRFVSPGITLTEIKSLLNLVLENLFNSPSNDDFVVGWVSDCPLVGILFVMSTSSDANRFFSNGQVRNVVALALQLRSNTTIDVHAFLDFWVAVNVYILA